MSKHMVELFVRLVLNVGATPHMRNKISTVMMEPF